MFGELASGKRKQGRPLKRFKDCVKASISHAEITPKELEPRTHDRTGWRALTRHTMDTFEERCPTHRSRRPRKEERCWLMLLVILISSHARTVPGPAGLGLDSTATSEPMADGSNAEERHHQFRWTSTTQAVHHADTHLSACPDCTVLTIQACSVLTAGRWVFESFCLICNFW